MKRVRSESERRMYSVCVLLLIAAFFGIFSLSGYDTGFFITGAAVTEEVIEADLQQGFFESAKMFVWSYPWQSAIILLLLFSFAAYFTFKFACRCVSKKMLNSEHKKLNEKIRNAEHDLKNHEITKKEFDKITGKCRSRLLEIKYDMPKSESVVYKKGDFLNSDMIEVGSFERFRAKDILVIIFLALLAGMITLFINSSFDPQYSYIISLMTIVCFMCLSVNLVRKVGSSILYNLVVSLISFPVQGVGETILIKLSVLVIAGLVFEVMFNILRYLLDSDVNIIVSATFSAATIPLTTISLASYIIKINVLNTLFNLTLLSALVGFAGAIIAFLFWYNLKITKPIMKFEYASSH